MTHVPSQDEPATQAAAEAAARDAESRAIAARARALELRRLAETDAASPAESETAAPATTSPPPRRANLWVVATVATMAAATVASAGLSGVMLWQRHTAQQQQQRIAQYSAVAKQSTINMMSLDYTDAKATVQRVIDGATGTFKDNFSAQADAIVKAMQDSKVVTSVTVQSVAVEQYSADSAVVLIAAQSQATNVKDERKDPQKFRVVVSLSNDNGQLKTSQVEFL